MSQTQRDPLTHRILQWGLANAFNQKFNVENRAAAKGLGGDPIEMVPFGGAVVTTTNNHDSSLARLGQAAVVALGVGAGGLGLANLAGLVGDGSSSPESNTPPAATAPAEPVVVEGIIDWEFDGNEFRIDTDGFSDD